jgi:hypothetical protein
MCAYAAPPVPSVYLRLATADAKTNHLEIAAGPDEDHRPVLRDRILGLLTPGAVLTRARLRHALSVKNERLGEALESLKQAGQLRRTSAGWSRVD